ncbi:MAG: IS1 family transposase [Clostridia bacterium]|jgi:transposase-like protein|nr:IS1 family transposase [Clostridia bacterium]
MGERGPKQKYTDVSCPNEECEYYGVLGEGNIVANGTYKTKSGTVRKFKCKACGRVFNDRTGTAYEYTHLSKEEHNLIVACQANGLSVRRTAEVVGCTPKTVLKRTSKGGKHAAKVSAALESKGVRPQALQFDELLYTLKKT